MLHISKSDGSLRISTAIAVLHKGDHTACIIFVLIISIQKFYVKKNGLSLCNKVLRWKLYIMLIRTIILSFFVDYIAKSSL